METLRYYRGGENCFRTNEILIQPVLSENSIVSFRGF